MRTLMTPIRAFVILGMLSAIPMASAVELHREASIQPVGFSLNFHLGGYGHGYKKKHKYGYGKHYPHYGYDNHRYGNYWGHYGYKKHHSKKRLKKHKWTYKH